MPTWAHVESRSTTMVLGHFIGGSKAKIGKQNIGSRAGNQDILRLEISVVYSQAVTVLHGIEDLKKSLLDKSIITHIPSFLGNIGKKVSLWTILQDDIGTVFVVDDLQH